MPILREKIAKLVGSQWATSAIFPRHTDDQVHSEYPMKGTTAAKTWEYVESEKRLSPTTATIPKSQGFKDR